MLVTPSTGENTIHTPKVPHPLPPEQLLRYFGAAAVVVVLIAAALIGVLRADNLSAVVAVVTAAAAVMVALNPMDQEEDGWRALNLSLSGCPLGHSMGALLLGEVLHPRHDAPPHTEWITDGCEAVA